MSSPAADDPFRFTTLAHGGHRFHGPLFTVKAAQLVALLGLKPGSRVADIGCGKANLLALAIEKPSCHGIGIDINPHFLAQARRLHFEAISSGRLALVEKRAQEALSEIGEIDSLLCIGATHYIGGLAAALADFRGRLPPGGTVLLGEGFWKQRPARGYLDILQANEEDLSAHADNVQIARKAGFDLMYSALASSDEWDEYEGLYSNAIFSFCTQYPDDDDAGAWRQRIERWQDGYIKFGRDTLGFAYYVLRAR